MTQQLSQFCEDAETLLIGYEGGRVPRSQLAEWASARLRSVSSEVFDSSEQGQLIEYVLSRMIDDDWTDDSEFVTEIKDLRTRLHDARLGRIRMP